MWSPEFSAVSEDPVGPWRSEASEGLGGATWAVILVLGFVVLWTFVAGARFSSWRSTRHVARSRRVGHAGERRALRMLRKAGYGVLEHQPTGVTRALVDGVLRRFPVRADALVTKRRRVYVAEFKGAPRSARVEHRFTRRQLLEYAHAFDVDGVLLVDAARGRIIPVQFLGPSPERDQRSRVEHEHEGALEDDVECTDEDEYEDEDAGEYEDEDAGEYEDEDAGEYEDEYEYEDEDEDEDEDEFVSEGPAASHA